MTLTDTRIDRVTVYRNGALVVRKGEGNGLVEVLGLPLLFSSDSLRVRPALGVVENLEETVRLRTTPAPPPPDEAAFKTAQSAIERIDDELRTLAALIAQIEATLPEPPDPRRAPDVPDVAQHLALLQFAQQRSAPLRERRRKLTQERRLVDEGLRTLAARDVGDRKPPVVTRGCAFTLSQGTPFELEYFVSSARWVPSYTLHLDVSGARADQGGTPSRLVCGALVAQATGEDWRGAQLAVSTADLLRETNLPSLSSWRIGRAQPARRPAWRPLPNDLPALFSGWDRGPQEHRDPGAVEPTGGGPTSLSVGGRSGEFVKVGTDEVASFEKSSTPMVGAAYAPQKARPAPRDEPSRAEMSNHPDALDDDEATGNYAAAPAELLDEGVAMTRAGSMGMRAQMAPPMSAPSAAMMPGAPPPPPSRKRGGLGFGGGGASRAEPEGGGMVRVHEDLPERWRTAYLMMAGPTDHGRRGQLLPLNPLQRMEWLLQAHDVDGAGQAASEGEGRSELARAVKALAVAQRRLEQTPLPQGTSALLGTHFFAVFEARERTDVPGDGTFYRVEVRRDDGPARLEHRCVPRESKDVWRFCKLELKGVPLPAGPLAVYENGAFKVNARLDGASTTKTLDINLGVDPDVRVVGRTVHTHQQEKGLVSQTSRVEHKVKLELRNTRKEPVDVVVYDRMPVPADNIKDIHVVTLDEKPPAKRTNKDAAGADVPGGIEWRIAVMPGELFVIQHGYAIDLPAKAELEGGNRRE